MDVLQKLGWINRHGTACILLTLLLLFCAAVHTLALAKITILGGISMDFSPRLIRNMTLVQFIHFNWWFVLSYLVLFFGTLIYMEIRSTPRWAVWSSFGFMLLPVFGYLYVCIRVSSLLITTVGLIQSP